MGRFGYPVLLDLAGRRCVVVGRRAVGDGKVEGLLAGGATEVLVLADGPEGRLAALRADHRVRVEARHWRPEDLEGAVLVVGSPGRDAGRLAREARARGALVNVVDDPGRSDVAAPAVVRRGELVVAIGTGGSSPALARRLREDLEARLGPHLARLVEVVGDVRRRTLAALPDPGLRAQRWREALDLAEAEALVAAGRDEELRERLTARLLADGDGARRPGSASGVGAVRK